MLQPTPSTPLHLYTHTPPPFVPKPLPLPLVEAADAILTVTLAKVSLPLCSCCNYLQSHSHIYYHEPPHTHTLRLNSLKQTELHLLVQVKPRRQHELSVCENKPEAAGRWTSACPQTLSSDLLRLASPATNVRLFLLSSGLMNM